MLIVAGIPNQPAKFSDRGMQSSQHMIIGMPMKPTVQRACSVIVLRAIESVTLALAQIKHKFRTCAMPTRISSGLPPMILATSTTSLMEGYRR